MLTYSKARLWALATGAAPEQAQHKPLLGQFQHQTPILLLGGHPYCQAAVRSVEHEGRWGGVFWVGFCLKNIPSASDHLDSNWIIVIQSQCRVQAAERSKRFIRIKLCRSFSSLGHPSLIRAWLWIFVTGIIAKQPFTNHLLPKWKCIAQFVLWFISFFR